MGLAKTDARKPAFDWRALKKESEFPEPSCGGGHREHEPPGLSTCMRHRPQFCEIPTAPPRLSSRVLAGSNWSALCGTPDCPSLGGHARQPSPFS